MVLFRFITILLLVVGFFFRQVVLAEQPSADSAAMNCEPGSPACALISQQKTAPKFIAYYFHRNKRCMTCRGIEMNAERVIRQSFAKELQSGKLDWRVVNIDESENSHFISDFNLYSSSLVIVDTAASPQARSVNLEKVWPLAHSESAFDIYVAEEVRKFIGLSNG